MDAIESVKSELRPRLEKLVATLNEQHEVLAASFFTNILVQLVAATEEEDLLAVFIELSGAAFQGFAYDEESWALADDILAYAQNVAEAFTADPSQPH